MRHSMALVASLALLGVPATALAQGEDEECPPGGWFCDEEAGGEDGEADDTGAESDEPEPVTLPPEQGSKI